jgi:tetratricopeptide (TPR) repeat protein
MAAAPVKPVAPVQAAAPLPAAAPVPSCLPEIAKAEMRYGLPEGLLVAIALAESGRRDPATGTVAPWPWTINSHGDGEYFETMDAAAARAGELLTTNGDGLVDVGCMQVDLYHHPHAFQTLLAAFDPETNVDYAARFLVDLKDRNGGWISAVAAYNAGDPTLGADYVARVLYYWKGLGTRAAMALGPSVNGARPGFLIDTRLAPTEIAAGFVERKDYASALTIYHAVLTTQPDDQTALLGLAQTLRATGRNDEARQELEKLLTDNPGNRAALGTLLTIIDEMPPARRLVALLSARQVTPDTAEIPARIAVLEQSRGNLKEAIAQMGLAARLAPEEPIMQLDYALLLDQGGYARAAADAYVRFLNVYRPGTVALTVSLDQIRQRLQYLRAHSP